MQQAWETGMETGTRMEHLRNRLRQQERNWERLAGRSSAASEQLAPKNKPSNADTEKIQAQQDESYILALLDEAEAKQQNSENDDLSSTPSEHDNGPDELIFDDLALEPNGSETLLCTSSQVTLSLKSFPQHLIGHPRFAAGVIAASLLVSVGLVLSGYCWFMLHGNSQTAEAVSMLGLTDAHDPLKESVQPVTGFTNLQKLQRQTGQERKNPPTAPEPAESLRNAFALPLLAQAMPSSEKRMLEEIKQDLKEPSGRPDPFSPLVRASDPNLLPGAAEEANEKRDILLDLQYTGFIGDVRSKDKVAIIKVNDPNSGQKTVIHKVGDSVWVEGERVLLKGISKEGLQVSLGGKTRWIELHPYDESSTSTTSTTSPSSTSTPASSADTTKASTDSSSSQKVVPLQELK